MVAAERREADDDRLEGLLWQPAPACRDVDSPKFLPKPLLERAQRRMTRYHGSAVGPARFSRHQPGTDGIRQNVGTPAQKPSDDARSPAAHGHGLGAATRLHPKLPQDECGEISSRFAGLSPSATPSRLGEDDLASGNRLDIAAHIDPLHGASGRGSMYGTRAPASPGHDSPGSTSRR